MLAWPPEVALAWEVRAQVTWQALDEDGQALLLKLPEMVTARDLGMRQAAVR